MIALLLALVSITVVEEPLPGVKRVLLLGDSITAAGHYTADIQAVFATQFPKRAIEFINLGLPSEGVTGLSEPKHPWPRPNVHERLERALTKLKPDVVFACYGMNDGIYHPFSDDRFTQYQKGINEIVKACEKRKIPLYLITPPPFDPAPLRSKLKGPGADDYGWMAPYEQYQEEVIAKYADWIRKRGEKGVTIIDVQGPILAYLDRQRTEKKHVEYRLADDGVHMNKDGHWIMAKAILKAISAFPAGDSAKIDATSLMATEGNVAGLKREAGGIHFQWTSRLPTPTDSEWSVVLRESGELPASVIEIRGLKDGRYTIYEGNRSVGVMESKQGVASVDVRSLPELTTTRNANQIGEKIRQHERLMSPAWLDHVGHTRPDTAKGLPLNEALEQAEVLTREIQKLNSPVTLDLSVRAN